jgi:hypothetical protein
MVRSLTTIGLHTIVFIAAADIPLGKQTMESFAETAIAAVLQATLMGLLGWGIWKAKERHRAAKKQTSPAVLLLVVLLGAVALSMAAVWSL